MNSVVIVGRVGQDADIKYFESGKIKTSFSVASSRWDAKTQSEVTDWFNVDVWDKLAEIAGEYVKKGTLLAVEGRISSNKWKDNASGEEREKYFIIANNIRFLSSKRDDMQNSENQF